MRNNTRKIDAIVILGGGITAEGVLSHATRERLDCFLKKRKALSRASIILSGRWSGFMKVEPRITEAQEMKEYLIKHGVGAHQIIIESESLDTISNAVFVRQVVDRHRHWKKILLITSDWHMERALWIFQRILVKSYKVTPLSIVSEKATKERRDYEKYLLAVAKRFLKDPPTSSKELIKLLKTEHPFYSKSEKALQLLKAILTHKEKMSA